MILSNTKTTKYSYIDEEDKKPTLNEMNSLYSTENNVSTRIKKSFDENENCFQLNFLNSFNNNINRDEYDDDKLGIFNNTYFCNENRNERRFSIEAEPCMMFLEDQDKRLI